MLGGVGCRLVRGAAGALSPDTARSSNGGGVFSDDGGSGTALPCRSRQSARGKHGIAKRAKWAFVLLDRKRCVLDSERDVRARFARFNLHSDVEITPC